MHHTAQDVIKEWPKEEREAAGRLIEEYGEPAEVSESLLTWRDTPDGWKRSELSNEPTPHTFPASTTIVWNSSSTIKCPSECSRRSPLSMAVSSSTAPAARCRPAAAARR